MELDIVPSEGALESLRASAERVFAAAEDGAPSEYWKYHSERLALDLEWASRSMKRDAAILEIGGYPFFLTCALTDHGYNARAVDRSIPAVVRLAKSVGVAATSCDIEIQQLPFSSDFFDEVLVNEVFEHLRVDIIFTFKEVHRVLRPGGRLWLSTPNLRSLRGIANFLLRSEAWSVSGEGLYAQYHQLRTQGWMGHVREYTSKEVTDFLREIGFRIDAIVYRGSYRNHLARGASRVVPSLRPYFSVVATKSN